MNNSSNKFFIIFKSYIIVPQVQKPATDTCKINNVNQQKIC